MLKKVLLLLVVGMLLIGIQAYAKTFELSPAQMAATTGGNYFSDCNKQFNCLGHDAGCISQEGGSVLYQPYLHWQCGFTLAFKRCENFTGTVYCGQIREYYFNTTCGGEPDLITPVYNEHVYCAL
jgi:hypothetical protein